MRTQDAVEAFGHALDLGQHEAAIYVQLVLGGPSKAGEIANSLKLHRNEVYRNATRLLSRGLIQMTMERPARYEALPPQTVFDSEIAARTRSIEELRTARDSITPLLVKPLIDPAQHNTKSTYKVIQGREDAHHALARLVDGAQRSVEWACTFVPATIASERTGALDAVRRAAARGVAVRVITRDAPGNPLLALAAAEVRTLDVESTVRLVLVDGESLLMWVVHDPSDAATAREDVALQTTAEGFLQAEQLFFEQCWARARPTDLPRSS
jgi:HTH-type transcriptional regulator, sugar sensing transcriptional regulator